MDFIWNENNVCLNPIEECVFKSKHLSIVIGIATFNGLWYNGHKINYSDGCSSTLLVTKRLKPFDSKIEARNAAIIECIEDIKNPYRDYDNTKAIKDLNSSINQLNLFE